ncbi:hypothetical protein NMY22_g6409 [Coprinellus aureogranulatus]|nr:hypothetical protein NMY22_g6409 [Coprinellus aureogranulatus]
MDPQGSKCSNTMINNRNIYQDGTVHNQAYNGGHIVHGGDNMNVYLNGHSVNGGARDRDDLFSLLNPIPDASHTRNLRTSPPNSVCFPGTRQDVIADVRSWVNSSLKEPHVMWIYGKGQLAAAFFFFRGAGDRSRASRFATTIASQMARAIPVTASHIKTAIKKDPGLRLKTTSLTVQFDGLVYGPIKAAGWDRLVASLRKKPFLIDP